MRGSASRKGSLATHRDLLPEEIAQRLGDDSYRTEVNGQWVAVIAMER